MRHGKEVDDRRMRTAYADLSRAVSNRRFTGPWRFANERHHEYATLEHLLLALIDDEDAAAVMRACNVDLEALRRNLIEYVDNELANLVTRRAATTASRPPASSASSSARSSMSSRPAARR